MELYDNALSFLSFQVAKTSLKSFSAPARDHLATIRGLVARAEETPDQFSAASMAELAEACGHFILARRQNPKPVSFRALVLMDAAYTMIESIAELAKENGHMPTKHQLKIDRAMKHADEALPGWPSRGTFFRLDCAINAMNGMPTRYFAQLTDPQFHAVDQMRHYGSVALSDAATHQDFNNLMGTLGAILPLSDIAEQFRLVAFHLGDAKNPVAQMQAIVATPLPDKLQRQTTLAAARVLRLAHQFVEAKPLRRAA